MLNPTAVRDRTTPGSAPTIPFVRASNPPKEVTDTVDGFTDRRNREYADAVLRAPATASKAGPAVKPSRSAIPA
jgi:hypothetical protein